MVVCGGRGGGGGVGGCLQGLHMFYSLASDVKSFCISVSLLGSFSLVFTPSPPIPLVLVCGKYLRIHCFFSATVPGGCRSQGCHGYPTRSARRD